MGPHITLVVKIWTLCIFVVYFSTTRSCVSGGDSGELITEAFQLGSAHPPGYPTLVLQGYLFTRIFANKEGSNIEFISNCLSASISSICGGFLFLVIAEVIKSSSNNHYMKRYSSSWLLVYSSSAMGTLCFSFSHTVWRYSVEFEVFSANNFFTIVLLFLACRYYRTHNYSIAYMGAFISGFGLTNQHTLVIFVARIVIFVLTSAEGKDAQQAQCASCMRSPHSR